MLAVILARVLGAEGFGIYVFCISIVNLLTVPAMMGGQNLLVREIAAYKVKGQYHFLRGMIQQMRWTSITASFTIAFCGAGIGLWVYQGTRMQTPFLISMAIIPFVTAMNLQGALLRGLRYILLGRVTLALLPLLTILLIFGVVLFPEITLDPVSTLGAYGLSAVILVVIGFFLILRLLPPEAKAVKPEYETSRWIKSMLPFVFAGGMQVFNKEASIVFLGIMQDVGSVGLFRVAQRGAELIPFGLLAVNMAIAPSISGLYAKGDMQRLQYIINKSIIAVTAFAVTVTAVLITGGKWLLPLIFGQEFLAAYTILVILCIGQLVNAITGSAALVMNMIGMELMVAWGMAIASLVIIVLNLTLIPSLGATGAAIASSASLMVLNISMFIYLYRKTGIFSAIKLKTEKKLEK
jgi:O-antigen/teichoic acid export membrane protein